MIGETRFASPAACALSMAALRAGQNYDFRGAPLRDDSAAFNALTRRVRKLSATLDALGRGLRG